MSIELRSSEKAAIEAIWAKWQKSTDLELESNVKGAGLTGFLDVVARLRAVGLREQPQQPLLNIFMPGCLRFQIVGAGAIQDYCQTGDITKVPFTVIRKVRCNQKGKDDDHVDLVDYGVRIKIRREENLDRRDARVVEVLGKWARTPKRFRYMRRYTYIGPENSGLRFDLSMVRESAKDSRGDFIGAESFKMADIMRKPLKYEIEVEADRTAGTKTFESSKGIINGVSLLLQGLQRSYALVRRVVAQEIVELLAVATETRPRTFPGPQPATLERANIAMEAEAGVPNIRFGDYNVTDKADGLRTLLVVSKTGRIFLVDSSSRVYATGLQLDPALSVQYKGTVLDGEWVRHDKKGNQVCLYYAFDIFTTEGRSVSGLPFMLPESEECRIAYMKKTVGVLSTAKQSVVDIPASHGLIISMKTFYSTGAGEPGAIFRDAAACLDASMSPDNMYYTDGLIFTPNSEPMPKTGKTWAAQLKWKPAHDNTIDFLVAIEQEQKGEVSEDRIGYKYNEDEKQMIKHKTLRLFVGGKSSQVFREPREAILYGKALPESVDSEEYQPVEFRPLEPADTSASICHIALNSGASDPVEGAGEDIGVKPEAILCTRSKDPITTNCIVEMAYHPEKQAGWRWEPIRVRWDKTERLQTGEYGRTMNADWVADGIWASIHNPVTEDMIRTGGLSEEVADERPVYYKAKKAAKRDTFIVRKMNLFHNIYIKSEILLQKTLRKSDNLMDLGCGRGGDIKKWLMNGVGWVFGVDYNLENLTLPKEGIYGRYLDLKIINKGAVPPMVFVQGDITRNIKDGSAAMTDLDKHITTALYDNGPKMDTPPAVETLRGFAGRGFDVVSCMFAIHYAFKDRDSVDGLLSNISDNLKVGGYFIGCCFDGDSIYKLLADLPEGGLKTGSEKGADIWSIKRSYPETTEDVLLASEAGLGKAIDVFYYSIGEEHREYLVSFEYLKKRMAELGCELLNPAELSAMGLNKSTNMFGESHKMTGSSYVMSKALKDFSFLNRWFIFRRRTGTKPAFQPKVLPLAKKAAKGMAAVPDTGLVPLAKPTVIADPAPEAAAPEAAAVAAADAGDESRPIYKFFHNAVLKDELKVGRKDWARYISPSTQAVLRDINDASITYPSLDAAFASTLYQLGTDKPDLGATLFSTKSTIHQTLVKALHAEPRAGEKRKAELEEEELIAIRNQMKPAEIKRTGAKFNEAKYMEGREAIMQAYIQQRYDTDSEFKRILNVVKERNGILVYYNGPKPSELGGIVRDEGRIEGQNKLGIMYMRTIGLTQ